MMIRLQKYDIEVKYEKGSNMFLANTLSTASIPRVACVYGVIMHVGNVRRIREKRVKHKA
jgi:hypothetical protein